MTTTGTPNTDRWDTTADLSDSLAIGDCIEFTKTITNDDVQKFAQVSGDTNPLHTAPDAAEDSIFGEQIAHGILVSGLISAALARLPGTVVYVTQNLEFLNPAYLDDELCASCEITDVDDDVYEFSTAVTRGETIIIDGTATVLIK